MYIAFPADEEMLPSNRFILFDLSTFKGAYQKGRADYTVARGSDREKDLGLEYNAHRNKHKNSNNYDTDTSTK